jgi:hypothetical protein
LHRVMSASEAKQTLQFEGGMSFIGVPSLACDRL